MNAKQRVAAKLGDATCNIGRAMDPLVAAPSHSIEIEAYMAFGGLCPRRIFEALPSTRSGHPDAAPKGQIATLRQL